MNKAEIRNAARAITELEVSDVADTLIDLYIKDGYDRMISIERAWPLFETSATLTTTTGVRDYALSAVGGGNFRQITSLVCTTAPQYRLRQTSFDAAEDAYLTEFSDSGPPMWWSLWADQVNIWPIPNAAYTLLVRGHRKATDWHLSDSTEVDADPRLHRALIHFAVAEMFKLQEDPELSAVHRQAFDESVRMAHADIMRAPVNSPLILSGGQPLPSAVWW